MARKKDRRNDRYGRVVAIKDIGAGYWLCRCDCGNEARILSTNLANYAKNNRGCKHCANRQDITGEERGLLIAESVEAEVVVGRPPLWTFRCRCGNSIQGEVKEFRFGKLRSCGCHDNAWVSWSSMMSRCYDKSNNRYNSYGGRGITVCDRWHTFENFVADMGERPKRHNLSRKRAEEGYCPDNCIWEHISKNCRDTNNDGSPTVPGRSKGARWRSK